jgi:hypothetical protein
MYFVPCHILFAYLIPSWCGKTGPFLIFEPGWGRCDSCWRACRHRQFQLSATSWWDGDAPPSNTFFLVPSNLWVMLDAPIECLCWHVPVAVHIPLICAPDDDGWRRRQHEKHKIFFFLRPSIHPSGRNISRCTFSR